MALYQRVAYITPKGSLDVVPQAAGGGALGAPLFISKRAFTYNTYAGPGVFNLDRPGLVALVANDPTPPWGAPYAEGGFRIMTEADGTMDVMTFMESLSALCSYGTADEPLTQAQLTSLARTRPLEMRCGPTAAFVRGCATGVGIETRQVHMLNVSASNGFDDGHVALEAKLQGEWKLFDVPNDTAWVAYDGELLSLAEVVAERPANLEMRSLAQPRVGRSISPGSAPWVAAVYEMTLGTPQAIRDWCERIYEVPGMAVAGGIVWGVPDHLASHSQQIATYPGTNGAWTTLPFPQWVARFYP